MQGTKGKPCEFGQDSSSPSLLCTSQWECLDVRLPLTPVDRCMTNNLETYFRAGHVKLARASPMLSKYKSSNRSCCWRAAHIRVNNLYLSCHWIQHWLKTFMHVCGQCICCILQYWECTGAEHKLQGVVTDCDIQFKGKSNIEIGFGFNLAGLIWESSTRRYLATQKMQKLQFTKTCFPYKLECYARKWYGILLHWAVEASRVSDNKMTKSGRMGSFLSNSTSPW